MLVQLHRRTGRALDKVALTPPFLKGGRGDCRSLSNSNHPQSPSIPNAVRLAKNNPFALSLSKGLMNETLRQAQGERG